MDKRKFDGLLRVAVGFPVIALALCAALLLWEIQSLRTSLAWLDHRDQVISADRELIKLTIDMETGVRGYQNTGRTEFLQPYNDAAPVIDSKFAALTQLVSDNRPQQAKLAAIQSSFDRWRLLAERAVELHRTEKENSEFQQSSEADSLELKHLMDSIRAQYDVFNATEIDLRAISAHRARGMSRLSTITCILLALVGGCAFALFIRRQIQFLGRDFRSSLDIAEAHAEAFREQAELLDLAYDTIVVRALDGTIRFWNHGAEQMYGYSKQQATGKTSQDLLHTVFPEPLHEIEEKLLRDGRWEGELIRTVQDGKRVIASTRWVSQRDKNGLACGVMEIGSDITERRRSEEGLQVRELLLQTVAEHTEIGLAVLGEGRRYLYCNPAHAETMGLTSAEIVGRRVSDVMGDSYNQVIPRLDAAFAGEQVDFELTVPAHPGVGNRKSNRLYAFTYKLLKSPGDETRVIVVAVDITERKRTEEALRISQERYSAIVSMAMDGVISFGPNRHIVFFNAAAEKIFGCPAAEAIGQSLDKFIPPQIRKEHSDKGAGSEHNGTNGRSMLSTEMFSGLRTNYGIRSDGTKFPLEATISQINMAAERLYTVILRDITQRKEVEEELREKEERFRSMYEHAAVGFAQVGVDGVYLMVNRALCEMLGYSQPELLNRTSESVSHPEDRERESVLLESLLSGESDFYEIEKRYVHHSGATVWVSVTSSIVRNNHQRAVYRIAVVQDITRRKQAEDQLHQAQKMEAIGRLAGGVAHDFNNLLTVILGYSQLALAELPVSDPNHARFQAIESSGETAAALTKQLLAFSRKQVMTKQIVDLKEIVIGMEPILRRLLPSDIEILIHTTEEVCSVEADPSQLKQILINLVVNAGDAMRHGGNLTIDVGTTTVTDELQQDASLKPGQFNLLTVSDTGSGMDAETVAHIFEPFFTTKPVGAGTGLGLATIYGIAHQCGGTVLVSSSPGGGSTFRVYLPRSSKDVLEKSTTDRGIHRLAGTETILLVDDSAPLRNMMLGVLSQKGYSVLDAADGVTALEISRNYAGTIDLLITDIVMPRMGGVKLAEHIVQERPDIGLIFVTGYATDKYVIPQQRAGRTTTLEKPYGTDALLRIVRGMLDEMKSLQPARR